MAKSTAQSDRRESQGRTHVTLPQSITSTTDVVWPGSNRGGASRNAVLRAQMTSEVQDMEHGSVRRYDIVGTQEQKALVSLFRSVTDAVHGPIFGVSASHQESCVFVKLGDRKGSAS